MRRAFSSFLSFLLVLLLTQASSAQNVSIQLTPQGIPIQIPASGGSFNYTIAATNSGATPQQAAVWCMITMPNGNPYGPVLGPVRITLSPGQTIERQRTQAIPAGFPAGNYSFNGYIGVYPDSVWDSDSFLFEKLSLPGGTELWIARYNGPGGPGNNWDKAYSIAVDGGGNVYVTGYSGGGVNYASDYATIKYNSAGVEQWVAHYNGPGNGTDVADSIAVDGDGNVYVTGYSMGSGTDYDYATIKYNSTGVEQWVARYNGPGNWYDHAHAIAIDGIGNVYVTGYSYGGEAYYCDYATIKYNSDGEERWVARYNGPGSDYDRAVALAVDSDGNVYVTGCSCGREFEGIDYATIKYDSAGVERWVARYNGPANRNDWASSMAVDERGNVHVTGFSDGSSSWLVYYDYATVKYNSVGIEQWVARYNGPGDEQDYAESIALDGRGNVYVTGSSEGISPYDDYATIKYNSAGVEQWVARYNGPGNSSDHAKSIAVDRGGNVYVTGRSYGSGTSPDYATIKYNSTGVERWVARYNGPGDGEDNAYALAVDGGGNVYVTGCSDGQAGAATDYDCATIKYSGGNIANWMPVEATVLGAPLPQECRLEQNYPNPFNASTALSYQLPVASRVSLRVYNTAGRLVATLVDGWRAAGKHELTWDARDLPSGMYVYRIQARQRASVPGEWTESGKIILLK
jgi:uncharacterized delta-60 repeat protein